MWKPKLYSDNLDEGVSVDISGWWGFLAVLLGIESSLIVDLDDQHDFIKVDVYFREQLDL